MDLKNEIQTLHAKLKVWRDSHPQQRLRRVDCIEAELEIGATAIDVGWADVAEECFKFARASAATLGIRM